MNGILGPCFCGDRGVPKWQVMSVFVAVFAVALAIVGACTGSKQSEANKITYAMPITLAAAPVYVALEKGFWKDEGLDVTAQMFSAGRLALDALLAKSAQVMSVSETPLMHAILQGHEVSIVTTVTRHKETKGIARKDRGINMPADLKGKRIATLPGTNSDYFMYEFLRANKILVDDVKITSLAPPEMVTAFVNGDIDAYFAWEPHIYYAQKQIPDSSTIFAPLGLYEGRHCVAMNADYVKEHPEIVSKLIRGFFRAEDFIRQHRDESKRIVASKTGMPADALDRLWSEYDYTVELDSGLLDILHKEATWARNVKNSTEAIPDFKKYIYLDALKKERPSSVTINQ